MKRPASPFTAVLSYALGTLIALALGSATASAQSQVLTPENFTSPKLRGWINGVPDTGQFLPDTTVILRVNDRVIRVRDYIHEYFTSYPEYRPAQDSAGRHAFMMTLRNREVLGINVLALNRPQTFEDRLEIRKTKQGALTSTVHTRLIQDKVVVSEEEIRSYYDAYQWSLHLRHILVSDRNAAERVRRELVSGRITWAAAVKKYSLADNKDGSNGDLGWVSPDKLDPKITYGIYRLKPGETSLPVQDIRGWHIVQATERRPMNNVPDYSFLRRPIEHMIRSQRETEMAEEIMATIRARHGVVQDSANALFAASRFTKTTDLKQETFSATLEIDASMPEFDAVDTARVLLRWKGGRYTIHDLLVSFGAIPPVMRPALTRMDLILHFAESVALEPFIAEHGILNGLETDSLVTLAVRRKTEQRLTEAMYADSIQSRVWVSRTDREAYYKANMESFITYPAVRYVAMWRPTKAGADSLEARLRAGEDPAAILRADSLTGLQSGAFHQRQQNENFPHKKIVFEELRPGGISVSGPDKQGDYIVIKLLEFDSGRQLSFKESDPIIMESMQNQREEQALNEMIERFAARCSIELHPERLMWIRLVDPLGL